MRYWPNDFPAVSVKDIARNSSRVNAIPSYSWWIHSRFVRTFVQFLLYIVSRYIYLYILFYYLVEGIVLKKSNTFDFTLMTNDYRLCFDASSWSVLVSSMCIRVCMCGCITWCSYMRAFLGVRNATRMLLYRAKQFPIIFPLVSCHFYKCWCKNDCFRFTWYFDT